MVKKVSVSPLIREIETPYVIPKVKNKYYFDAETKEPIQPD